MPNTTSTASASTLSQDPTVIIALASSALAPKGPLVRARDTPIGKNDHAHLVSEHTVTEPRALPHPVPLPLPPSLRPVVDALSEVPVHSENNPQLACGLRAHESPPVPTLELIVCGDRAVHERTVQHLRHTWALMARMSALHAKASPPNATEAQKRELEVRFGCALLGFAVSDLRRAFAGALQRMRAYEEKRTDTLASSQSSKRKFYEYSYHKCSQLFLELLDYVEQGNIYLQSLPPWNENLRGEEYDRWKDFYDLGNELLTCATKLLGDDMIASAFSKWERFVLCYVPTSRSLRKDIEAVARLPRHIHALMTFAHSDEHRGLLGQTLVITKLEPVRARENLAWPLDANTWEAIRDLIYAKNRYVIDENASIGSSHDTAALLSQDPTQFVLHAELSLLTYLHHTLHSDSVRTFNYIRISGLACKACSIWIRAFNAAHRNANFGISGSHNEWVPGWVMPPLAEESQELRDMIVSDVLDVYFWYMGTKEICRKDPTLTSSELRDWRREEDHEDQHPSY